MISCQHFASPARPSATPIVLVHGFPLDRRIFSDIAPLLATHRPVFAVDLAGFGQSPYAAPFSLDDQAGFLRDFIVRNAPAGAILAGLSMGGYVALAYHRLYASTLKVLILMDTKSVADTEEAKTNRTRMAEVALREGVPAVARMMSPRMFSAESRAADPTLDPRLDAIMLACPAATIAHACLAMRDRPDYTADLGRMTLPLLMVTGQKDVISPPEVGRAVAAAAAFGTYAEIPSAGHIPTMEQPAATAEAINTFLLAHGL